MNANEVIASLAGDDVHPNDDVNMGQSSNDVFPSAVHLAALDQMTNGLLPALAQLAGLLEAKAAEFDDIVKSGRTHLMDAVPVTLGQEFGGYAAQVRQGSERIEATFERVGRIPPAGRRSAPASTPIRSSRSACASAWRRRRVFASSRPPIHSSRRPRATRSSSLRCAQSRGGLPHQGRERPPSHGLGPARGLMELRLPELQKGSSIMPARSTRSSPRSSRRSPLR